MTVRREMAEWRVIRGYEMRDTGFSESRIPNFEPRLSRFSRQSRPSRLSQASAIAVEEFMNNAGKACFLSAQVL